MTDSQLLRKDNGGMRSGKDRRQVQIVFDFADRRSGRERRTDRDRRSGKDRRSSAGFRALLKRDRRSAWEIPDSANLPAFSL